jgi:hypothetical protein
MFRGIEVVGGMTGRRAALATGAAGLCLIVVMAAFVAPTAFFVTKEAACPTRLG